MSRRRERKKQLILNTIAVLLVIVAGGFLLIVESNKPTVPPAGGTDYTRGTQQTVPTTETEAVPFDIASATRLNGLCAVLTFDQANPSCWLYRSENGGSYIRLGQVSQSYYYDWTASAENTYSYYLENDRGLRSPAREVGYNAKPVTNVAVLMYHYFLTDEDVEKGHINNNGSISVDELEADLKYFQQNNIRTITCQELVQFWNGQLELPEKCVMITVDDGHYSIFKYMAPLLEKYNCKANIAIIGEYSTDLAPTRNEVKVANYWMTWDEIAQLGAMEQFCFGSHSNYMHNQDRDGRYGIRIKDGESVEAYKQALLDDMKPLNEKLKNATGYAPGFMAVPFNNPSSVGLPVLTEELGYDVILVGDSEYYCKTRGNCYVFGLGADALESRLVRRFARHRGDDIGALLEGIWNNES